MSIQELANEGFLNGTVDAVTHILTFATTEELGDLALVSKVFNDARNSPLLDQTRTGTIILNKPLDRVDEDTWVCWNYTVFTPGTNRTRCVIIVGGQDYRRYFQSTFGRLWDLNIREVIVKTSQHWRDAPIPIPAMENGMVEVPFHMPSTVRAQVLDVGSYFAGCSSNPIVLNADAGPFKGTRNHLQCFRCMENSFPSSFSFLCQREYPSGEIYRRLAHCRLREIHINPFGLILFGNRCPPIEYFCNPRDQLEANRPEREFARFARDVDSRAEHVNRQRPLGRQHGRDWIILDEYPILERVTLKQAKFSQFHFHGERRWPYHHSPGELGPWNDLPQAALIKFVRNMPTLRWFCSDLTLENIAMLQAERPEVEFLN